MPSLKEVLPRVNGRIAHAPTHVDPILNGSKWVTARVNFERHLSSGDRVALHTPDSRVFALATVTDVQDMSIAEFVEQRIDGHRTYDTVDEAIDGFAEYYPEVALSADTKLTVIWFEVVESHQT